MATLNSFSVLLELRRKNVRARTVQGIRRSKAGEHRIEDTL